MKRKRCERNGCDELATHAVHHYGHEALTDACHMHARWWVLGVGRIIGEIWRR